MLKIESSENYAAVGKAPARSVRQGGVHIFYN